MQPRLSEGKKFNQYKQLILKQNSLYNTKGRNFHHNINSTFVTPLYISFSLAANIIVYTAIQGRKREKYLNHIFYKGKMPTLAENKHLFGQFFSH